MTREKIVAALREHAEWAAGNEWETPITLGDDLSAAADLIENQQREIEALRQANEGSDPSAASGGYSEVSEWPRSKFQASAVRQRGNFGHRNRNVMPYDNPSVGVADSSLYTREPGADVGIGPYEETIDSADVGGGVPDAPDGDEICRAALETFGERAQMGMAVEEMSELTKELCKRLRGRDNLEAIAEEIADVQIMLRQLVILFDCKEVVDKYRRYKLERLARRVEEAKQ